MVYDVFHKFHRDRFSIANTVDKWFEREKMMLVDEVRIQKENGKCAKFFATDRGGFTAVAQAVKAQLVKDIHAPHASKRGMVYSDNIQENRNYQNSIYQNQIT